MPKLKLPGWNRLILAMMYEDSQPSSHWRTYLDILPRTLNTPVFWTSSQLDLLSGSAIVDHIGAKKIKSEYNTYIAPLLKKAELYEGSPAPMDETKSKFFNFDQYKRFGSLIMAYSFTDDENEVSMVPMADMLNHRTGCNNARLYFNQEDDAIEEEDTREAKVPDVEQERTKTNKKAKIAENDFLHMRTRRNIAQEEELFNTYGTLSDAELLRKYGYTEELGKNRWNDIEISVALIITKASASCGWDSSEVYKRRKFIKDNALVDPSAVLEFFLPQEKFGEFDPLETEESVVGGLNRDIVAIAKIFAAAPSDWISAEKAILESKKMNQEEEEEEEDDDEEEEENQNEEKTKTKNSAQGSKHSDDKININNHHHGEDGHVHTSECNHAEEGQEEDHSKEKTEKLENPAPRKRGGDLIVVSDMSKLTTILKAIFEARIQQYGPNFAVEGKIKLEALPAPGSQEANEDVLRTRAALIVKLGEIQILECLIDEAEKLSK